MKRTTKRAARSTGSAKGGPIVCGTDFSIHAAEAANAAAAMANALGKKMVLVHVADPGAGDALRGIDGRREKLVEEARRVRQRGLTVEEHVRTGSAVDTLTHFAENAGAWMLVLSSIGQVAPSRFLAGSVAERTAESSRIPTLVVREARVLSEWAARNRKLRVLVGCDFSPSSDAAIRFALGLRAIATCEIIVLHVNRPAEDSARLGSLGSAFQNAPVVERVLLRELRERVDSLGGDPAVDLRVVPSWGRVDAEILETARRENAQLLVVGTHQRQGMSRLWLGSVSRAVLRHAASNVAIVPAPQDDVLAPGTPEVRRVLVTTDLSGIGNQAIAHAYSVLPAGGGVCLVHVLEGARNRHRLRDTDAELKALIPADAEQRGVKTTIEILNENDVPQAIYRASERFGADVICIASHGRTGLLRTLLGSVAHAVVERSTRPVLLIRPRKD